MQDEDTLALHASAVVIAGKGCLITGASGTGKSTLAIELMALGAGLISDDRVELRRDRRVGQPRLMLAAPAGAPALIEARHVGLLEIEGASPAPLVLIVDLDRAEPDRLPRQHSRDLLGLSCPVIFAKGRPALASILAVCLRGGGLTVTDRAACDQDGDRPIG